MRRTPAGAAELLLLLYTYSIHLKLSIYYTHISKWAETLEFPAIETLLSVAVLTTVRKCEYD
jgi:hypothetical protein